MQNPLSEENVLNAIKVSLKSQLETQKNSDHTFQEYFKAQLDWANAGKLIPNAMQILMSYNNPIHKDRYDGYVQALMDIEDYRNHHENKHGLFPDLDLPVIHLDITDEDSVEEAAPLIVMELTACQMDKIFIRLHNLSEDPVTFGSFLMTKSNVQEMLNNIAKIEKEL